MQASVCFFTEGVLPKGAAYITAASTTEDSNRMLSEVMDYLEKESASISAIANVNGNSHQTTSVSARLYNNMIIIISFRLELIPPRGAVNHSDPSSPLLPVTSSLSTLFNRRAFMSCCIPCLPCIASSAASVYLCHVESA